jgi:hypothetical protein
VKGIWHCYILVHRPQSTNYASIFTFFNRRTIFINSEENIFLIALQKWQACCRIHSCCSNVRPPIDEIGGLIDGNRRKLSPEVSTINHPQELLICYRMSHHVKCSTRDGNALRVTSCIKNWLLTSAKIRKLFKHPRW